MARKVRPACCVQVLERAVDILQVLSEDSREPAAGEVAERLSLQKSTTHPLRRYLSRRASTSIPAPPRPDGTEAIRSLR